MRLSFRTFQRGLWVSGPREQTPEGALRRATGVGAVRLPNLRSRWGHSLLTTVEPSQINALARFAGLRWMGTSDGRVYTWDGVNPPVAPLFLGLNGRPLRFVVMPASVGGPDVIFMSNGGQLKKGLASGTVQKWGIDPPPDGMTVSVLQEHLRRQIDSCDAIGSWTAIAPGVAGIALDATIKQEGTGSLRLYTLAAGALGYFSKPTGLNYDLNSFGVASPFPVAGDFDAITFWLRVGAAQGTQANRFGYMQLVFRLSATPYGGSLKTTDAFAHTVVMDKARLPGSLLQPVPARLAQFYGSPSAATRFHIALPSLAGFTVIDPALDVWQRVKIPRGAFTKVGGNTSLGWSDIERFEIYLYQFNTLEGNVPLEVWVDDFALTGGYGLKGTYEVRYTYRNSVTGSRSNPNPTPIRVFGVDRDPLLYSKIPLPTDPQVDEVELWRTVGDQTVPLLNARLRVADLLVPPAPDPYPISYISDVREFTDGTADIAQLGRRGPGPVWPTGIAITPAGGGVIVSVPNDAGMSMAVGARIEILDTSTVPPTPLESRIVESIAGDFLTVVIDASADWFNGGAGYPFRWEDPVPELQGEVLPFDNDPPFDEFTDVVGPHFGRLWWLLEGEAGQIYYSPPGRPEAFEGFTEIGNRDDVLQKLVVFDGQLYAFSSGHIYLIQGSEPPFVAREVFGAPGTIRPLSVTRTSVGVCYQAEDGVRVFDGNTSRLLGFDALGTLLRGIGSDGLAAFEALFGAASPDELLLCEGTNVLALSLRDGTWRHFGVPGMGALFYEAETGLMLAGRGGDLLALEREGVLTDAGDTIPFVVEVPGGMTATDASGLLQRLYIDVDTSGQQLTPILILDGQEILLPPLQTAGRAAVEYALNRVTRVFGVRLLGALTQAVQLYGIEADVHVPGEAQGEEAA